MQMMVQGFAKLLGDALAMGIGDYVSSKSEFDFAVSERDRELWFVGHITVLSKYTHIQFTRPVEQGVSKLLGRRKERDG
jgi:hypothetical protein